MVKIGLTIVEKTVLVCPGCVMVCWMKFVLTTVCVLNIVCPGRLTVADEGTNDRTSLSRYLHGPGDKLCIEDSADHLLWYNLSGEYGGESRRMHRNSLRYELCLEIDLRPVDDLCAGDVLNSSTLSHKLRPGIGSRDGDILRLRDTRIDDLS